MMCGTRNVEGGIGRRESPVREDAATPFDPGGVFSAPAGWAVRRASERPLPGTPAPVNVAPALPPLAQGGGFAKRRRGILLLAALAFPAAAQPLPTQAAYDAAYAARRDALVARVTDEAARKSARLRAVAADTTRPANVMTTPAERLDLLEAALLVTSGRDAEAGNRAIRDEAAAPFRGGMFYIHDVMAATLHGGDRLAPATRAAVRESLRRLPIYRGDTENHFLLYYTGLYLAAQTWPGEPETAWFNGRSSEENLAEARGYLDHWMAVTTTLGQGEFDSPTYLIVFLAPMFTLYTHATDPVLKAKAGAMLDWLLADYAADYLKGLYAGAHSRDYTYDAVLPERAPSVGWGWLFFGSTDPVYRSDNLTAAWSGYRLPVVIHNVAVDRTVPYEQQERKRVRNVIRYGDEASPPVYKQLYMTADYALGSMQGGILQPIQQHTWDVTFDDADSASTVFTLHPYVDPRELAMFFPEEPEWLSNEVDRYHKVYTDPDKWNASSPYERTFQHRNALVVLYDLPDGAVHPHVDGFFPKTLRRREVDASGWIFAQGGRAYVAVRPLAPHTWIEEPKAWRLRGGAGRSGFVVEVAQAGEYASWEAFKARIRANALDTSAFAAEGRVAYTTSAGNRLAFSFPDGRVLNGAAVDYADMPLFRGRYLNGDAGRLTVTHGGMTHVIDVRR